MIEIAAVPPLSDAHEGDPIRVDSEELVKLRYASYLSDESGLGPGLAEIAILPTSEKQVADFLREMNARKIPVTLSGGRTGLVGGAIPNGGALLTLERMNRIIGIRWDGKRGMAGDCSAGNPVERIPRPHSKERPGRRENWFF